MVLESQKHLFDIPDDLVYLNCAAQSPCLLKSAEAGRRGVARKTNPWDPDRANVATEMEACRDLFGRMVGATAADVAITFSTSYGVATAAQNLSVPRGQEIVLLDNQFPSNYYAWQKVAARDDADLRLVPRPTDFDWTAAVLEILGQKTGLVALPNCHWTDGSYLDLVAIGARSRELDVPLIIDATQSVGALPTDIKAIQPDYLIVSAYKWLLCPDMMGFTYVAPHRQDGEPLENNHQGRSNAPPMEISPGYSDKYGLGAKRFDMGAADSMIHLPMSKAALEQIQTWGIHAIQDTLRQLTDRIAERAETMGFWVPPVNHRVGHFIGLWPNQPLSQGLVRRLADRKVYVSLRCGAIRVSPYLFNEPSDIDTFFEALELELTE